MALRSRSIVALLASVLLAGVTAACGGSGGDTAPGTAPASGTASSAAPSSAGGAAEGLCALFSPAEVASVLGGAPKAGTVAGPLDTGCQWLAAEGEANLLVQQVGPDDLENWSAADGYRELPGVGDFAYLVPHPLGLLVAARTATSGYLVLVDPVPADEAASIELLRQFIERAPETPVVALPSVPADSPAPGAGSPGTGAGGSATCPLTDDQVAGVFDRAVTRLASGCSWGAVDAGGGLLEAYYEPVPAVLFSGTEEDVVEGLGDTAYVDGSGTLYVLAGDHGFSIQVLSMGGGGTLPSGREAAIALARLIVGSTP